MSDELKPCPFCGKDAKFLEDSDHHGGFFYLGCGDQECAGYHIFYTELIENKASCVAKWNRRVAELESAPAPQWTRTPPTEPGWYARWLECWDEEEDIPNICHFDELSIVNMRLPWIWLRIPTPELPKEGTHANPQ